MNSLRHSSKHLKENYTNFFLFYYFSWKEQKAYFLRTISLWFQHYFNTQTWTKPLQERQTNVSRGPTAAKFSINYMCDIQQLYNKKYTPQPSGIYLCVHNASSTFHNQQFNNRSRKIVTESNIHSKIKIVSKLGIERNFLNLLIKHIYQKPAANIILSGEILLIDGFFSDIRNKATCSFSPLLFNILLKDLANIMTRKGN